MTTQNETQTYVLEGEELRGWHTAELIEMYSEKRKEYEAILAEEEANPMPCIDEIREAWEKTFAGMEAALNLFISGYFEALLAERDNLPKTGRYSHGFRTIVGFAVNGKK